MDGGKVSVFEKGDEVSLGGFLESHDGGGLETQVGLEVLSDLTDETLEGELPDEEFGRLLVTTDFSQSDGTGAEPVRLLHTTSDLRISLERGRRENEGGNAYRGLLASRLSGELLPWGLATGGFAGSLLGTSHG